MALEVLQSSPSSSPSFDFDFNHGRSSPFLSTPSSPKGFGLSFFSTPTSPAPGLDDFGFDVQPKTPSGKPSRTPVLYHQLPPLKQPPQDKKSSSLWSTFSPRGKKSSKTSELERGRERVSTLCTSKTTKRQARSLSPEKRRWRLKDLLLFRSASEGRGSDKDPFKKYNVNMGSSRNVRMSSAESSTGASKSNKRGQVSAHELHYKANKAMSEDMRKKSFLPYKQGILGRLAVNPTVHALAHGFGSLAHSHQIKYNY